MSDGGHDRLSGPPPNHDGVEHRSSANAWLHRRPAPAELISTETIFPVGLQGSNRPNSALGILVTFAFAMLFPVLVHAAQVIPSGVEYTNDTIEQRGKLAACIVTTAIISPPAPEIVNFQVLVIGGTHAFKVTAGDVDWTNGSGVAKRISAADFSTAQFNHPSAFKKSITSEGQLVGYLRTSNLNGEFLKAFFGGRYTIRFIRTDQKDERTYYIEQAPGSDVTNAFRLCLGSMRETR
jgi:hypothetical protein